MSEHSGGNGSGSGEKHVDLIEAARNAAGSGSAAAGGGGPLMPGGESVDLGGLGERFEILERISGGGQGVVHRARQFSPNREVAIKLMQAGERANEQRRARFAREAELVSRLSHPNIIRVYESGVVDGRCYFAMEYVDGMSIDDFAMLNGSTAEQLIGMLVKVCRAISHAHQKGIIHRDIKPGNILVTKDGEPHVLDFGLAREAEGSRIVNAARAPSMSGQVIGTTAYLSPEQAKGKSREADTRTDVYGLGVTLYYLLAQQFPYDIEGSPEEVRERIIRMPALPLRSALKRAGTHARAMTPALAADVEALLAKALEKDPELRYRSAADMADELERCLKGEPVAARASNRVYRLRKWARRHRLGVTVGGLIAVTVAAALVVVTIAWRRSERFGHRYRDALLASAQWRIGVSERNNGQIAQAISSLREATKLVPLEEESDVNVLDLIVTLNLKLADALGSVDQPEDRDLWSLNAAIDDAARAAERIPSSASLGLTARARVLDYRSLVAEKLGDESTALAHREDARGLREEAVKAAESFFVGLDLALGLRTIAMYQRRLGMLDLATINLCAASDLATQIDAKHPGDAQVVLALVQISTSSSLLRSLISQDECKVAEIELDDADALLAANEGVLRSYDDQVKKAKHTISSARNIVQKRVERFSSTTQRKSELDH